VSMDMGRIWKKVLLREKQQPNQMRLNGPLTKSAGMTKR
jgi:hypothetical protein